jgi:choline dehydrogenase
LPKPYYWHPLGKVLGGGSAINAMVHAREQSHDFDHWEKLENKRWGYNDLLPYIMKNEGKTTPQANGFVSTSKPDKASVNISKLFLQTTEKLGLPDNPNFNHDNIENHGIGTFEQAISQG